MRTPSRTILAFALLLAACGDDGLGIGGFGTLDLSVDDRTADPSKPIQFVQALQLPVSKNIEMRNIGGKGSVVTIRSVDWDKDASGTQLKNQYIDIDFLGGVDANTFPLDLNADDFGTLAFKVTYTPPLGKPLDDFSDSVLLIKSNNIDNSGKKVPEIRLTFHLESDTPVPRVSPTSFTFRNATPSSPESQDITIYNDEQLGNGQFTVTSIRLETDNPEFKLDHLPSDNSIVLGRNSEGYRDLVFRVTYTPTDNNSDTNAILITTDAPAAPLLRVDLGTNTTRGSYELSFDDLQEFDFSNVTTTDTRRAIVASLGPGPITIRQPGPTIEPAEARRDYTVTAYIPNGEDEGAPVTSWPRALGNGKSVILEVKYTPRTDGTDSANGELVIPYGDPDVKEIRIPIFSGDPKSKLVLGPSSGNITVTGDILAGDHGTRKLVVYNDGNGPLHVSGVSLRGTFEGQAAKVWSLVAADAAFDVPAGGLHIVELAYDLSKTTSASGNTNEAAVVHYHDDYTDSDLDAQMGLLSADNADKASPVASPGSAADYTSAVAGEAVTLVGTGSTPGGGTFTGNAYIWYLTAKPSGSFAKLNITSGPSPSFVPDVAGSYTVELIVFSKATEDLYLYSEPASVTFTVAAP